MLLLLYKYIFECYLLQSWIIQQNFVPTEAAKKGLEKGVCGDCPLKLSQTGACFVNLLPVNNIYRTYFVGNYQKLSANEIEVLKRYRYPIIIGSYGDPTAVPFDVWEPIISASGGYTGYTHQWFRNDCDKRWQKYLMASVQSESEARIAQNLGWRTFRIIAPEASLLENEILCRHTENDIIKCEFCKRFSFASRFGRRITILFSFLVFSLIELGIFFLLDCLCKLDIKHEQPKLIEAHTATISKRGYKPKK